MTKKLVIIGAGGQGKVCAEIAGMNDYETVVFLDDDLSIEGVSGPISEFGNYLGEYDFFVAIGNNGLRKKYILQIIEAGGTLATLIHPNSVVSPTVSIGKGTVVMAGAIVNCESVIGNGVILNTGCSVDHNNELEDFVHISVGAHLAGTVNIGECSYICAGSTVINNVSVCGNCIIGAGAVVISDIDVAGTYVGVPARRIR